MQTIYRRDFLKTWGAGALALAAPGWTAPLVAAQTARLEGKSPAGKSKSGAKGSEGRARTTVLEDMGKWLADLRYEELPPEVVNKARLVLLDTLGCALGAIDAAPVRIAREVIAMQGGKPQATLIGIGSKFSCEQAAFLNGMAIRYLDYNDYAAGISPHHCSINVAPALAIAEMRGLGGKELILGMVAGYEVQLRLRDASEVGARSGFDYPSITTQYGAAATAAKVLGLDARGIAQAIAIAGANANTLSEVRGDALASGGEMTPSKGTADPMGVRAGTFAALLAQAGLTYPLSVIDGKGGYGKVIAGVLNEDLLRTRSGEFQIMKSCNKMWPCAATVQAPIAAALKVHEQKAPPDEIENITIALSAAAYKQQQDYLGEITVREHADHSIPYAVSRALADGEVRVEDFDEKRFREPRVLALVKKVTLRLEPSLTATDKDALGANVEVRLKNGNVVSASMPNPPGTLQNPADEKILTKKFLALAEGVLGKQRAAKAPGVILSVDQMTSLGSLVSAVSPLAKDL